LKRFENEYKLIEFLNWVEKMKTPLRINEKTLIKNPKEYAQMMKQCILKPLNRLEYIYAYQEIYRLKRVI